MEVRKIIGSQAVRLIPVTETDQKPIGFARFLKGLEQRYSFLQAPRVLSDFNLNTGIPYLKGLFEGQIIERVAIYGKGILCESPTDTTMCDQFLDDVQAWGEREFGFSPNSKRGRSDYYESHLEVHAEENIGNVFQRFSSVGQSIWEKLKSYEQAGAMFEVSGLKFHTDTIQLPDSLLHPIQFTFERRAEHPYFANIYYSQAPLKTEDHITVLGQLETVFKN
jgi:hypothetical protein